MKFLKETGASFIEVIIALAVLSIFLVYFSGKISDIALISAKTAKLEKLSENNLPQSERFIEKETVLGEIKVYNDNNEYYFR